MRVRPSTVRRRLPSDSPKPQGSNVVRRSERKRTPVCYDDSLGLKAEDSVQVEADESATVEVGKGSREQKLRSNDAPGLQARGSKGTASTQDQKKQKSARRVTFAQPRISKSRKNTRKGASSVSQHKNDDMETPIQSRKRPRLRLDSSETEPESGEVARNDPELTSEVEHSNQGGKSSLQDEREIQIDNNAEIEEIDNPSLHSGQEASQALTMSPRGEKSMFSPKATEPSNVTRASDLAKCQMAYTSLLNDNIEKRSKERAALMHDIFNQATVTDKVVQAVQDTAMFWHSECKKQANLAVGYQGTASKLKETRAQMEKLEVELAERGRAYKELEQKLESVEISERKSHVESVNASVQTRFPDIDPSLGEDEESPELRLKKLAVASGLKHTPTNTVAVQVCPESPTFKEDLRSTLSPYFIFGRSGDAMDLNAPLKTIDVDGVQDEQLENTERTIIVNTSSPENQPNDFGSNIGSACTSKSASQSPTTPQTHESEIVVEDTQVLGDTNGTIDSGMQDSRFNEARKKFGILMNMGVLGFSAKVDESGLLQKHEATGFSFRLQHTQEYRATFKEIACPGEIYAGLRYTPLGYGSLGGFLPEWMKEGMVFPLCDAQKLIRHILDAFLEAMKIEEVSCKDAVLIN